MEFSPIVGKEEQLAHFFFERQGVTVASPKDCGMDHLVWEWEGGKRCNKLGHREETSGSGFERCKGRNGRGWEYAGSSPLSVPQKERGEEGRRFVELELSPEKTREKGR